MTCKIINAGRDLRPEDLGRTAPPSLAKSSITTAGLSMACLSFERGAAVITCITASRWGAIPSAIAKEC
jgi:hypothetical protein